MYDRVIWPEKYDPKTSAIYALNDIDVRASPEVVWRLLVDADRLVAPSGTIGRSVASVRADNVIMSHCAHPGSPHGL